MLDQMAIRPPGRSGDRSLLRSTGRACTAARHDHTHRPAAMHARLHRDYYTAVRSMEGYVPGATQRVAHERRYIRRLLHALPDGGRGPDLRHRACHSRSDRNRRGHARMPPRLRKAPRTRSSINAMRWAATRAAGPLPLATGRFPRAHTGKNPGNDNDPKRKALRVRAHTHTLPDGLTRADRRRK